MKIEWLRCHNYQDAKNHAGIIYLHEWDGRPFYWGKADGSFFGGHKRKHNGLHASGRYNAGYRHWIEGCLQHGGRLYVGQLDAEARQCIGEVENFLIHTYGHVMNTRVWVPPKALTIEHTGDVPKSIAAAGPMQR
jgi:hypothetical protein